jgi:hypothetical protein
MQLVQLQQAQQKFKDRSIGLAAVSYDSESILAEFAARQHITFPLLADPQSDVIRKYGVFNADAKGMTRGMAYPGFIYIDSAGRVKEQFFEAEYRDRYTANNVIAKLFPELTEQVAHEVDAPHISLTLGQSDQVAAPGNRITLVAQVNLAPDLHVYAPGVTGYIPIDLKMEPSPELKLDEAIYPKSQVLLLERIKERVPVFEGNFRIQQDVTISATKDFIKSLGPGKSMSIKGELKYQACDKNSCYSPVSLPVSWEVMVLPLDFKRSAETVQHRE